MIQKNLAAFPGTVDSEGSVKIEVVQKLEGPKQKTDKQHAAELGFRAQHFTAWANALGIPSVTIAKQIVRNVADVEDAIRRVGKVATAPAPKAPKKPTTVKMTADEIAEAAGLKVIK